MCFLQQIIIEKRYSKYRLLIMVLIISFLFATGEEVNSEDIKKYKKITNHAQELDPRLKKMEVSSDRKNKAMLIKDIKRLDRAVKEPIKHAMPVNKAVKKTLRKETLSKNIKMFRKTGENGLKPDKVQMENAVKESTVLKKHKVLIPIRGLSVISGEVNQLIKPKEKKIEKSTSFKRLISEE